MKKKSFKDVMRSIGAWFAEAFRKLLVSLKKSPSVIPLLALVVAFVEYSLNLTAISDTTAKIQGANMGLTSFVTMLFMILSFVCMFSAYPKRKKPNYLLMALMLVLYSAVIVADVMYIDRIVNAITRADNPIKITTSTAYILTAQNVLTVHIVLIAITMVMVVLEPLFAKLLKKINTTVELEAAAEISSLDLAEEE
ncbi:MAG: hypothetical protein IKC32_05965 [Clostridia bacterium]|nr:hypothetical protein [Clostridia bacterium]